MQTFDQSLMQLFRSNIITYEEALRQSTNPDDFALRVSGISATSDSTWDNFDKKDEQPAQNGKAPASRPAAPAQRATATSTLGRVGGGAAPARPGAAPAKPAAPASGSPAADDDFQIERF
jgi:twitching motility protein PilT